MRTATGGHRPSTANPLSTRVLSLIMAFILMFGILPIPAAAADIRTDFPETVRVDGGSYTKHGSYYSPLLGTNCTIHDIRVNVGNGKYQTVFCGEHGKALKAGTWKVQTLIDGSNYAKADGPMRAPYMIFADYYYAQGNDDPVRNAWVQAAIWLMRGENSKYDFLMNSTVEEIESGTRDDFLMGVAEEAVKAAKTVNPSYSRTPVEMLSSIKEAVIIPWIKKDIPHLDYVLYYRDNVYQPLIMPLQPSDPPGDDEVWLKVQKVDSKGRPLASAVFGIFDPAAGTDGEPMDSITTGSDGFAYWNTKLDNGKSSFPVIVKELTPPPGCELDSTPYPAEPTTANNAKSRALLVSGKAIVNLKDDPDPGDGSFRKVDQYGKGIPGAVFLIEGQADSGDEEGSGSGQRVHEERESQSNGEIPIQWVSPDLPNYIPPGHYTIREIKAPAGYRPVDETRHIDLYENGDCSGDLIFVNEKFRTIKLIKQDSSGKGLEGAVFKVERDGQDLGSVTTGPDGSVVLEGENGTGVLPGLYTFTETNAPAGYLLPANPVHNLWLFDEGDTVEQYVLAVTNYQYPDIEIEKISRETGKGLAGATFEVRINAQTIDTFKTDANGKIRLTYAEYGEFLNPKDAESWTVSVREITAPDGYLIDDENWQEAEIHQGEKLKTFTFTDTRYPYIRILKRDRETGEPLPNTTFKVWIDGKDIGTKVTDDYGVITIDYDTYARFLDEHNHDNWTITVQEEEMPAFYNKDKQDATGDYTQTQTLKWGQSYAEFEFKDTHFRDLRITKRDLSNTWTLADATFTLDSLNLENPKGGPIHREGKTDGNGQLTFKDLPNGTYRVTETVPPTGYSLADPNWQDVTITSYSDRVIDIEFLNAPEQGLLIRKLDATTRQNLAGVSFEVRFLGTADSPNGTTNDPRTYVTDANGLIYLPDCEPGWYQITETAVPDGYIIDSEPRLVQIVNKHEPVTVTYENYQDTQLIILKKDAQTSLPLPGALFEITTAGGNYIATVETGPNGIGTLAGLEPGAYVITEVEAPDGHIIDPVPQTFEIRRGQTEPVFKVFYNDGKTNLFIRKEDAQTHIGLADAVYRVTLSDGKVIKERLVTGEDGLASLTDLLPGTYVVTEIEAPPGYLLNSTPQHVYLDEGRTETMLFRNNKPGGIAVLKRDAISGLPLAGAVFELRTLDGELIGKEPLTTGLDGYIRVPDLDSGWYILRETKAPDGYLLDSTDHRVYVEDFKVTYVYLDNYQKAGLTVNKIDSESKLPLAGAEFEVRDMKNSVLKTITTNSSGVATLTDIAPGWYKVVETKAPDGYVLNEKENLVQIVEGKPASVTVPNTKQSGITVHKVDATSREPLAGAEFELRTADGKLIDTYTTDVSGSFVTTNVEPGVYFLVEKKAPKGYAISTEDTKVIVPEGEYPVVTIENHKGTSIEILKVDSVTGKYLAGAEFELYTLNCEKLLGVYTTDKTGVAFTEPLPAGNYIVKESKAPEGYILDDSHHHVQVLYDHPAKLKVENVPLTGIMITKLSAVDDTPLMGAKFEIRTAEGKVVGEFTTDTAGDPIFAVEPGVYYVHETKAPDNYLLNDEVFRVEVTAGKIVPLVVRDEPACELVIFKGDAGNKKGIAGAVFKVETADRDFIGTYTTDAQGEAIVRPIAPGHYIVTEMSAPEGYSVSETPKTITVKVGVINRVEFVDAAMGSLVIRLEDQADGHKLENGRFQLYFAATGKLVNEGVTDNSGSIVWGSLLPGRYIIKQTYAPDGYTIIDAEKEGIVVSGETTIVVFKDYTAGLVIEKVDRLTGETLAGARFQVTRNSDNFVIGEYETDSNGLALVSGLTEGMYSVEELKAPTGYAIDEEAKLVHVKVGTEAHVTFQDTPNAGITIQTVDKDTQAPLSGVVIEVWQQNGVLVNTYTSDTTGVIQTDKLTAGFYVLKVIKAENGYKAVTTEQTVEIKNGTAVTVKFEFMARGLLQVYSLDNKEVGLPGMKVTISKQNGELVGNYATDANGLLTVEGLEPGWYIVKETNPPSGYTIGSEDSQSIEITSNGTATVKFYHGKTYGVQIRTSVKQTGVMVAGVKYHITTLEGTMVGTFTSDNVGIAYATLEPGWYVIKMVELPEGYKNFSLCAERRVEVKADAPTIIDFQLTQLSSIRVKFVNGTTGAAIYGVRVMLKDSTGKIVDEYTSNNEGYITLKQSVTNGSYTLEQISVPSGYTVDKIPKTIDVLNGETTEITWKMFTEGGQIQVHLTSTAYNSTLDLAAGSNLQGGVFEIYDPFTFAVMATITTDSYGVAASGVLPIGRYIIRQKTAPAYFGMTDNNGPVRETEVYIKINNDVVRTEYQNSPMDLKVTHKVTGNNSVAAGSSMKYLFTAVNNDSAERLDNYYWTITVPTDAMRAGTLFTGTWSSSVYYSISYKTNQNDYRPLASGLNSSTPYQYDLSSLAINVNGGEYVTHIRFEFGTVPAGFKPTQAPIFFGYVIPGVVPGYKVILRSECGGKYNGAWATSSALWTTAVAAGGSSAKAPRAAGTPNRLPTTGY